MRFPSLLPLALVLTGCRQDVTFTQADAQPLTADCDTEWFGDADGDGYGGTTFTTFSCDQPTGYVDNADDCDDLEPDRSPGAIEVCGDGLDNDCDGSADDSCTDLIDEGTAFFGEIGGEGGFELATGDINGDGIEDVLIGSPNSSIGGGNEYDGAVALFLGPHTADRALADADVLILGETAGKQVLGYAVDIPGDLDGDGLDDVTIAGTQISDLGGTSTGGVALFSATTLLAATEPLSAYDSDEIWFGVERQDYLGASLSSASTSDTITLFAGGSGIGESQGAVYLLGDDGALAARILGESEDDRLGLGQTVTGTDSDGDGIADVSIGAPLYNGDDGRLYHCPGPLAAEQSVTDCVALLPEGSSDKLGQRVVSAGDVDGDGLEDLWVSAPSRDGAFLVEGTAYLLAGRADPESLDGQRLTDVALAKMSGLDSNDGVGSAIARGADLDGDGAADALIGASQLGQIQQGVAMLFYGPLEGDINIGTADAIYTSAGETDRAGAELAILPALGGLLIDAPEDDLAATNSGVSWLVVPD